LSLETGDFVSEKDTGGNNEGARDEVKVDRRGGRWTERRMEDMLHLLSW
jgi:hypothetical protein